MTSTLQAVEKLAIGDRAIINGKAVMRVDQCVYVVNGYRISRRGREYLETVVGRVVCAIDEREFVFREWGGFDFQTWHRENQRRIFKAGQHDCEMPGCPNTCGPNARRCVQCANKGSRHAG